MYHRMFLTPFIRAMSYADGMKELPMFDFDKGVPARLKRGELRGVSPSRISITSAAVSFGILTWAIVNAYLRQA